VCRQEGIDGRFNHLDTTSFSLSGDYVPSRVWRRFTLRMATQDHRPDLKQAILELMVSQDGGVPFVSQSWDGNTSDTQIFQERAQALITTLKHSPRPRFGGRLETLRQRQCGQSKAFASITRIPSTLKLVKQVICQASSGTVAQLGCDHALSKCGVMPLWHGPALVVVYSEAAFTRAEATVTKAQQRNLRRSPKQLLHLHARRFETPR